MRLDFDATDSFLLLKDCEKKDVCSAPTYFDTTKSTTLKPLNNGKATPYKKDGLDLTAKEFTDNFCFPDSKDETYCSQNQKFYGVTDTTTVLTGYDGVLGLAPQSVFMKGMDGHKHYSTGFAILWDGLNSKITFGCGNPDYIFDNKSHFSNPATEDYWEISSKKDQWSFLLTDIWFGTTLGGSNGKYAIPNPYVEEVQLSQKQLDWMKTYIKQDTGKTVTADAKSGHLSYEGKCSSKNQDLTFVMNASKRFGMHFVLPTSMFTKEEGGKCVFLVALSPDDNIYLGQSFLKQFAMYFQFGGD